MSNYQSLNLSQEQVQAFYNAGFQDVVYEGQEGVFLVKKFETQQLPYVKEHLIDDDFIWEGEACVVELIPDGSIQLAINESDYYERYFLVGEEANPEIWSSMAKDAGVTL